MNKEENAKSIIETSNLLQTLSEQHEMMELQRDKPTEYETMMKEIAPDFYKRFPTLFQLIIDRKDIGMMHEILKGHIDHSRGNLNTEQLEERIGKKMANAMYEFK